jgi:hypothetical protein
VGIRLRDAYRKVVTGSPAKALLRVEGVVTLQGVIRVRIKATCDRMLFRRALSSLRRYIGAARHPLGVRGKRGVRSP